MVLALAHPNPWASASSYLSSQPLADSRSNLHTTKNLSLIRLAARATGIGRLPLPISLRSPSPILAATFMPPRGLPTLVVLPPVASSSVAPLWLVSETEPARTFFL